MNDNKLINKDICTIKSEAAEVFCIFYVTHAELSYDSVRPGLALGWPVLALLQVMTYVSKSKFFVGSFSFMSL